MIAPWFLLGCLTQGQFEQRYATEFCQLAQDCQVLDLEGYSTLKSCEDEASPTTEDCDTFDQKAAKKCISALQQYTCEDGHDGPPKSCGKVCSE